MKLYFKQKYFSLTDDFNVYDENQVPVYKIDGRLLSFGRNYDVYDAKTNERLAEIEQKLLSWTTKMEVTVEGEYFATVRQKMTFFRPQYILEDINWHIEGDIWAHNYEILIGNSVIATIKKKFLSWSDTYEVNILEDDIEPIYIITIVMAIDLSMDASEDS